MSSSAWDWVQWAAAFAAGHALAELACWRFSRWRNARREMALRKRWARAMRRYVRAQ